MRLTLTDYMFSLIKQIILTRVPENISLVESMAGGIVDQKELQDIIDVIAVELCEKGFDADSEPTAYGLELERLIDVLSRPNLQ